MILEQFSLKGKVAIVTGASRGLGQGMAVGLAEAGADIVGVASGDMTSTQKEVEAVGRRFVPVPADLRETTKVIPGIIEKTIENFGKIDILVNNAGIIRRQPTLEFSEEYWDEVMNINLKSAFFLAQAVANQFIKQGTGGKIINIASLLSFQGGILVPSYAASKHGIAGITKTMCNEWAKYNINVNAIAPGYMATDNTAPIRADEKRNQSIQERIPAGRWGNTRDLNGAVVFLASSASEYMHGHVLCVDGGWLAR
ncbi:2-dehydro-3-deoxy-D-gluconate 5-dehydrogenase KduD [Thermanaerosceptrum fracticalcis]|uniref:2-dehydro-3-deoxy-D-gluconate 5-dehydrogenase n=1 Tax=Thermanaerosceptrum fracticalcis TaxID=1712410 RepID=A0A7G6DZB6_THEFR|nr:2-dehydro-3-deoxy-D-gluconate 5-dehydrogenase KduD [Thermanaerosceptrum fracticalcis]QNB45170.1 2-dehydro-3-deoxy-D-gluconate 5-dehydrogenase KduD [Thermanaerosceptrum fracticalcis]